MFVRLVSASGAKATEGFASADEHATGDYEASVLVPEGGIGGIQFGLAGSASGPSIPPHRSDMIFPLMNGVWTATVIQAGPPRHPSDPVSSAPSPASAAAPLAPSVTAPMTARTGSELPRPGVDPLAVALVLASLSGLGALLAVGHRARRTPAG